MKWCKIICLITLLYGCDSQKYERIYPEDVPVSNLEDISISVDKEEITTGEEIKFTISGKTQFLTFFSGELDNDFRQNPNGGVEHKGKIDTYHYVFREEGTYEVFFKISNLVGEERVIGPFNISVAPGVGAPLNEERLTIITSSDQSGRFLVDFANLHAHTMSEAYNKQEEIDLFVIMSGNFPVMLSVSGPIGGWANGRIILGTATVAGYSPWTTLNKGNYMRLDAPSSAEVAHFESLSYQENLIESFESIKESIQSRSNYTLLTHGLGERINGTVTGDIFYFKSEARPLYAAFRVLSVTPPVGGVSEIEIEVKSILVED